MPNAARRRLATRSAGPAARAAQAVMLPAPRHTTMSPGLAMAWIISARCSGPGSGTTLRWPLARRPSTSASRSMPGIGCLAGGIDIGHDHGAGVVHAGAELLEQRLQAGVAVRLHHRDHVARAGLAGGLQHGHDLDRVVAVIVDHGDAAGLAGLGEAALDALEAGEGAAQRGVVDLHLHRDGDGGQAFWTRCAGPASAGGTAPCGASGCAPGR